MKVEKTTKVVHEEKGRADTTWRIVASQSGIEIKCTAKSGQVYDSAKMNHEEARRILTAALECLDAYEAEVDLG